MSKVSTVFKKVVSKLAEWSKPAETRAAPAKEPSTKTQGWGAKTAAPKVKSDGFETAAKQRPSVASDAEFVKGLYRQLLGREPDAEGLAAHLKGLETGQTREQIQNTFLTSPEFQQKQAAVRGESTFTPAGTPGKLGPVPLEGYDHAKLNDFSHTTVKYQFGRVATNHPLDSVKDKAGAEALLRKMLPDLEAAGLNVLDVQGDKIKVQTELGHEWVDVVRGAGSGNPGWWWGSEGQAIPGTEGLAGLKLVTPRSGPVSGPGPTGPSTPSSPNSFAPLTTVPHRAEYERAQIDKSSPSAAAISAATWVKQNYPDLFLRADDRNVCMEIMTHVIGALRAAGYDATRVVNHPSLPQSNGVRYGSDAVVLEGRIYDVYGDMGASNKVQALDVGPYAAGRLRE